MACNLYFLQGLKGTCTTLFGCARRACQLARAPAAKLTNDFGQGKIFHCWIPCRHFLSVFCFRRQGAHLIISARQPPGVVPRLFPFQINFFLYFQIVNSNICVQLFEDKYQVIFFQRSYKITFFQHNFYDTYNVQAQFFKPTIYRIIF